MEITDHKTFTISDYILERTNGSEIAALVEDRFEAYHPTFGACEEFCVRSRPYCI